jgi:hypothetical protein
MDARQQRMQSDSERLRARKFWSDQDAWPFDAPGYVFIPRAIDALGKILFTDEWPSDILNIRKSPRITDVVLTLREHFAFGRLIGVIQRYNGTFEPLPAEIWNTRDYEQWFNADFKAPSTATGWHDSPFGTPECWLFVERNGLLRVTSAKMELSDTDNPPEVGNYLSPYMRIMLEAIRRQNLTREDQSTVESIKSTIREIAKEMNVELSERLEKAMPTLMREPESKKGRDKGPSKNVDRTDS